MGGLTPKQETFCLKFVELGVAYDAYNIAFPSEKRSRQTAQISASKLLAQPKIKERLAELTAGISEKVVKQTGIDAAWVLTTAVDLYNRAMKDGSYAPAKGALELIGKHVNVQAFREQHEHRLGMTTQEARTTIANLSAKYLGK